MRSIIFFFCAFLGCGCIRAQQNLLEAIGNNKKFDCTFLSEQKNTLFYFNCYTPSIRPPGLYRPYLITVEKADKNSFLKTGSAIAMGDTTQTDSTLYTPDIFACLSSGKIHLAYVKHVKLDTTLPINQRYLHKLYYRQLDTSLVEIVPETVIYTSYGTAAYDFAAMQHINVMNGNPVLIFHLSDTIQRGIRMSMFAQLTNTGSVVKIDTVPRKNVGFALMHAAEELQQLSGSRILIKGIGVARADNQGYCIVDSNFNLLDTIERKPYYIDQPRAGINDGYYLGANVLVLPNGNWINGGLLSYGDANGGQTYTAIVKLPTSSRYTMDTVRLFTAKDATDYAHSLRPSIHSLAYNPYDQKIYYSNVTHSLGLPQYYCSATENKNYVQVIGMDTTTRHSWRKFIYSGDGYCAQVGYVAPCNDRNGVLIAGFRSLIARPADTSMQSGFIYRIDSTTSTSMENSSSGVVIRDRFAVYPNPANDRLTIDDLFGKLAEVTITNMQGQVVFHQAIVGGKITISISSYTSGLYLVRARSTDNEMYSQKVLKR